MHNVSLLSTISYDYFCLFGKIDFEKIYVVHVSKIDIIICVARMIKGTTMIMRLFNEMHNVLYRDMVPIIMILTKIIF